MASELADLTTDDRAAHEADEQVIERGLSQFVEVGLALMRIRDRRSYMLTHSSFNAYLDERWGLNYHYAWELQAAAQASEIIRAAGAEVLPANPRVAFELRPYLDDPDALLAAWLEAMDAQERPTAKVVREVVRRHRPEPPPAEDGDEEDEEELPALGTNAAAFVRSIATAAQHVQAARKLQNSALRQADAETLADWHERLSTLRDEVRELRTAVARATRARSDA